MINCACQDDVNSYTALLVIRHCPGEVVYYAYWDDCNYHVESVNIVPVRYYAYRDGKLSVSTAYTSYCLDKIYRRGF